MSEQTIGAATNNEMRKARDFLSNQPYGVASTWQIATGLDISNEKALVVMRALAANEDVKRSVRFSAENNSVWELIAQP